MAREDLREAERNKLVQEQGYKLFDSRE
jgi:hypothetical protein